MLWLGYCGQPRRVLDYPSSLGGWHGIASAGHLLSVAALLSFFIMMYDSIRQNRLYEIISESDGLIHV
jgi:heme/copper-type cytochrome/quinol oxidase subunit 1